MRKEVAALSLLATVPFTDPSLAAATEPVVMEETVVTATRTERPAAEVPASVSVISAEDIRAEQATKVEDLLRNIEGVDIKGEAGGGAGMVILRGVGGSYAGATSQLLVDGMPVEPLLMGPKYAALDFVALSEIERIEVVRGPASALYGASAMGGVVNILTQRWRDTPGVEVAAKYGSHDSRELAVSGGGAWDKADLYLSATDFRTDGYVAQPTPYFWGQQDLDGNDWSDRKLALKLGFYPTEDQDIQLSLRRYETESGFLGGRPDYRWERDGALLDLGWRIRLAGPNELRFKYLKSAIEEDLSWDGLLLGDPTDFTRYITGRRDAYADSFEVQAIYQPNPAHTVTAGLSYNLGEQTETEVGAVPADSPMGWDYYWRSRTAGKTRVAGVYAQDEIALGERTRLTVGGRFDHYKLYDNRSTYWDNYGSDEVRTDPDSTDSVVNPRLGLNHKMADGLAVYAAYGTAYLPALNGLRYRSSAACSNPGLEPERSATWEVGARREGRLGQVRVALFHTKYEDKIEPVQEAGCTRYENVSAVTVNGVEIALEGRFGDAWKPYLNYTFNDAMIDSNPAAPATEGSRLNLVARHKLNLGVTWTPDAAWTLRLAGRYVGSRYFDATMTNDPDGKAPGYFVADFKVTRRLDLGSAVRDGEVWLAVDNLFDKTYVEQKWLADLGGGTAEAYRAYGDGRTVWVGFKTRF
ncbi:MAG: TonB-dependent receptor [Thiobacillus sp.]|nr:TonB-dependent receptor [Thiobacillus sp.]